jgi:hypothetical protein
MKLVACNTIISCKRSRIWFFITGNRRVICYKKLHATMSMQLVASCKQVSVPRRRATCNHATKVFEFKHVSTKQTLHFSRLKYHINVQALSCEIKRVFSGIQGQHWAFTCAFLIDIYYMSQDLNKYGRDLILTRNFDNEWKLELCTVCSWFMSILPWDEKVCIYEYSGGLLILLLQ